MGDDVENGQLTLRTGWTGQNPPKERRSSKNCEALASTQECNTVGKQRERERESEREREREGVRGRGGGGGVLCPCLRVSVECRRVTVNHQLRAQCLKGERAAGDHGVRRRVSPETDPESN
ncbi:hypothetical protein EYF80_013862 [Liparis tanakae]|uniref:Uncharacterized protein n=1 Tax=Liparis tanakae TaxID=230148 RepID=A0A4Z2IEZ5_9TELE|nr:hypothetical protein EYF80_013862 [Liparis tanakae]